MARRDPGDFSPLVPGYVWLIIAAAALLAAIAGFRVAFDGLNESREYQKVQAEAVQVSEECIKRNASFVVECVSRGSHGGYGGTQDSDKIIQVCRERAGLLCHDGYLQ